MKAFRGFESLPTRHPAPLALGGLATRKATAQGDRPKRSSAQGDSLLWYVYFLELSNGDIYVGSTNDLKRRFPSHQAGHVLSTKPYLPAKLRSYVAIETEQHARELEKYFKSGSGKAVALKRLIRRTVSDNDQMGTLEGRTVAYEKDTP